MPETAEMTRPAPGSWPASSGAVVGSEDGCLPKVVQRPFPSETNAGLPWKLTAVKMCKAVSRTEAEAGLEAAEQADAGAPQLHPSAAISRTVTYAEFSARSRLLHCNR